VPDGKPNILVIWGDDIGITNLSCCSHGAMGYRTPEHRPTTDWWADRHPESDDHPCCAPVNPTGGAEAVSHDPSQPQFAIPRKVVKGGWHLCADSYGLQYRPAARRPQMVDTGTGHLGGCGAPDEWRNPQDG
jgi:hypothetical protein